MNEPNLSVYTIEHVKSKSHLLEKAHTSFLDCLETGDLQGAHASIGQMLVALGALDEAFWTYAHRPIEGKTVRK